MDVEVDGKRAHAAIGSREANPDDPVVVLVHGNGLDRTIWQLQTRHIANRARRALAVDLPGHGQSEGQALVTIEEMADWVIRFMDASGVGTATLVGHSMGAFVTLEAAARHPDRVDKLCLMGIAETMPVHPELLAAAERNELLAPELIVFWGLGQKAQTGGHPAPGLWVHGASKILLANARSGVLYIGLSACNAYQGAAAAAALVKCPTLLVLGRDDKMAPAKKAGPLANAIAGSETVVIDQCGHMMLIERPNQVHRALMPFLP